MKELLDGGVEFSACKACADELGVTERLEALGIEVIYWGEPLTTLLTTGIVKKRPPLVEQSPPVLAFVRPLTKLLAGPTAWTWRVPPFRKT